MYNQNQFRVSYSVEIELSKSNFNLVFSNFVWFILNEIEKSKTIFDKFTYILENKKYEKLFLDKDHYNTFELISHPENEFRNQGHNKIFHYFFLVLVGLISVKIIFFYQNNKNNLFNFSFIFLLTLFIQILNSYFIYLLNNFNSFYPSYFYFINFIILTSAYFLIHKILK